MCVCGGSCGGARSCSVAEASVGVACMDQGGAGQCGGLNLCELLRSWRRPAIASRSAAVHADAVGNIPYFRFDVLSWMLWLLPCQPQYAACGVLGAAAARQGARSCDCITVLGLGSDLRGVHAGGAAAGRGGSSCGCDLAGSCGSFGVAGEEEVGMVCCCGGSTSGFGVKAELEARRVCEFEHISPSRRSSCVRNQLHWLGSFCAGVA